MTLPMHRRPQGMTAFVLVWLGQVLSLVGSAMSAFALTIWAWQITGSATALALVGFFSFGPTILLSPIAGALVDRWDRKLVMMLSDLAAGLSTVAILILYLTGSLQIWHLYLAGAFSGAFQAFQFPAYSAAITMMVPKAHYARAGGMMSLAEWGSGIFAPSLAGMLIALVGIGGVLMVDIATFVIAILALLAVVVPNPPRTDEGRAGAGSLWTESAYGFRYILARPGLLGLQLVFLSGNFLFSLGSTVLNPMILARTGNNAAMLGLVQSVAGAGGVAGSLAITAWGGPKRRVHGVLLGWLASGLLAQTLLGLNAGLAIWLVGSFFGAFIGPVINASNQAIWQVKVAPDVQGRVFSVRRLIAQVSSPLAMLAAGPLADRWLEPAFRTESALAQALSPVVGAGPGAGMGLMLVATGLLIGLVGLIPYAIPAIRTVETSLPDHGGQPEPAPAPAAD